MENVKTHKEKIEEIKQLKNFLKELNAKYIIKNNTIILKGKVIENVLDINNNNEIKVLQMIIKINDKNIITVTPEGGYIIFDSQKQNRIISGMFEHIRNIIVEENEIYIIF